MRKNIHNCEHQIVIFPQVKLLSVFSLAGNENGFSRNSRYHTLSLANQDMIRTAVFATKHGFKLDELVVANGEDLEPLSNEQSTVVSAQLIEILDKYGEKELHMAMEDDFDNFLVVGTKMTHVETNEKVELFRGGFVNSSSLTAIEDMLRNAWAELRIS